MHCNAALIARSSAVQIDVPYGSFCEYTLAGKITASAALLFSFEPSVKTGVYVE